MDMGSYLTKQGKITKENGEMIKDMEEELKCLLMVTLTLVIFKKVKQMAMVFSNGKQEKFIEGIFKWDTCKELENGKIQLETIM